VTLTLPPGPNRTSAFLNIRVADIKKVYKDWSAKGATFLTEPKDHGREIRAYIRDPDGHLIEVGQSARLGSRLGGLLAPDFRREDSNLDSKFPRNHGPNAVGFLSYARCYRAHAGTGATSADAACYPLIVINQHESSIHAL
jgi:hypothetical protein